MYGFRTSADICNFEKSLDTVHQAMVEKNNITGLIVIPLKSSYVVALDQ